MGETGYATILMSQINSKVPEVNADSLKIAVSISGIGGGSLDVEKLDYQPGKATAGAWSEQINTGASSVKIDASNIDVTKFLANAK